MATSEGLYSEIQFYKLKNCLCNLTGRLVLLSALRFKSAETFQRIVCLPETNEIFAKMISDKVVMHSVAAAVISNNEVAYKFCTESELGNHSADIAGITEEKMRVRLQKMVNILFVGNFGMNQLLPLLLNAF